MTTDISKLSENDWLQIEQAASGCISGWTHEWPALVSALRNLGFVFPDDWSTGNPKLVCQLLVQHRDLIAAAREVMESGMASTDGRKAIIDDDEINRLRKALRIDNESE